MAPEKILVELYLSKYGKFNYVSKSENKKLIKYQKSEVFSSPEDSYLKAGVTLVDFDEQRVRGGRKKSQGI